MNTQREVDELKASPMFRDRPLVYVSFNDGDPDIVARLVDDTPEQVRVLISPESVECLSSPRIISLYYLRPSDHSSLLSGDVIGKYPSEIRSITTLS